MGAYQRTLRVLGKLPNFNVYALTIKVHRLNQENDHHYLVAKLTKTTATNREASRIIEKHCQ